MENNVQYSALADDEIIEMSKQKCEEIKKIDQQILMNTFSEQNLTIIPKQFQIRQIWSRQDILDMIEMMVGQVGQQILTSTQQLENKFEYFYEIQKQLQGIDIGY